MSCSKEASLLLFQLENRLLVDVMEECRDDDVDLVSISVRTRVESIASGAGRQRGQADETSSDHDRRNHDVSTKASVDREERTLMASPNDHIDIPPISRRTRSGEAGELLQHSQVVFIGGRSICVGRKGCPLVA
jgi:hypothetical protein